MGVQLVPVYHGYIGSDIWVQPSRSPAEFTTIRAHSQLFSTQLLGSEQSAMIRTTDWIRPEAVCTATLIKCPVPRTWAQYEYETPDKMMNTRAPGQGPLGSCALQTDPITNEQFFEVEKTTCGATRTFDVQRGLVVDSIALTVTQMAIDQIMHEYAQHWTTTISPEAGGFGFAQVWLSLAIFLVNLKSTTVMACYSITPTRMVMGHVVMGHTMTNRDCVSRIGYV